MKNPEMMQIGTGEKTQYMVHDFNDNTIRFVLCYDGMICAEALQKAAGALAGSVDVLHSSFIVKKVNAYWQINHEFEIKEYFTHIKNSGNPMETAVQAALRPVEPAGKVQLHCTLIQGESDGNESDRSVIVFNISHLCVDGSDGKYLLGKLAEAYNLVIQTGNAEGLVVKNGNRAPEQIYENLSREEMRSLMHNPMSDIKTGFPYPTEEPGEKRMVWEIIPAGIMDAARQRGKKVDATANDILLTACYRGYTALPETDADAPISVLSMMDLRRHCTNGESDGLSNLSGSLPTALRDGVSGGFSDTLMQIVKQTAAAKENPLAGMEGMPLVHGATRTLPMGILIKVAAKVYGSFSLGFTNIGSMDGEMLSMNGLVPEMGIFGGPLKKKPAAQICAASFNGVTALSVIGEFTKKDEEKLQEMLRFMTVEVKNYAREDGSC